jgi:hypothetical protein
MPSIDLKLDGDRCWPDLEPLRDAGRLVELMGDDAPPIGVARLAGGMVSGRSSVTLRLDLPDGRAVITETSLALFCQAADLMRARDLAQGRPAPPMPPGTN